MDAVTGEIERVLALLAETPRRIAAITDGLDQANLHTQPDKDSWSANDIVAHLRANADVWGKSILRMITEDHPTIRYVSPREWLTKSGYTKQESSENLRIFAIQRDDLLKTLGQLATDGWARGATFTGTTRGREQTVLSYAQRIAEHEGQHLLQLDETINVIRVRRSEQADDES